MHGFKAVIFPPQNTTQHTQAKFDKKQKRRKNHQFMDSLRIEKVAATADNKHSVNHIIFSITAS